MASVQGITWATTTELSEWHSTRQPDQNYPHKPASKEVPIARVNRDNVVGFPDVQLGHKSTPAICSLRYTSMTALFSLAEGAFWTGDAHGGGLSSPMRKPTQIPVRMCWTNWGEGSACSAYSQASTTNGVEIGFCCRERGILL